MRKFKVIAILPLLCITVFALAQERIKGDGQGSSNSATSLTPEQKAEKQAKNLTKKLGLSADQTTKVQAIILEKIKKSEEIRQQRQSKQIDGRTAAQRQMALAQERDNEIMTLLNPNQQAKFKDLREKQKQKAQQRKENKKRKDKGKINLNENENQNPLDEDNDVDN
ncbi:MAG: hypothetical protein NZ551_02425 [Microscillaceae bacterium]|nr:hypothetical protein [Microscillaceae bacterium]MDW8460041.1 hypothetical protein [Cytophagales bacterium]